MTNDKDPQYATHLSNEPSIFFINSLNSDRKVKLRTVDTSGSMVDLKTDSGAKIEVPLKTLYNQLHRCSKLKPTSVILTAYSNIPVPSKCIASVTHKNTNSNYVPNGRHKF